VPQNGRSRKNLRIEVNYKKNAKNFDISNEHQTFAIPLFQPSHKKSNKELFKTAMVFGKDSKVRLGHTPDIKFDFNLKNLKPEEQEKLR
jgi:outer membrane protein OmpA-like peptidoglycan-associated protein